MKDNIIKIVKTSIKLFVLNLILKTFTILKRLGIIDPVQFDINKANNTKQVKNYTFKVFIQGFLIGLVINSIILLIIIGIALLINIII